MAKRNTERKLVGATKIGRSGSVMVLIAVTVKYPGIDSAEQLQKIVSDGVEAVLNIVP
jgi:hypothetical protein